MPTLPSHQGCAAIQAMAADLQARVTPIYETLPGWTRDVLLFGSIAVAPDLDLLAGTLRGL